MLIKIFAKNRYDDYDRDDDVPGNEIFPPPERLTLLDYVIAGILGVCAFLFVYALSYKGLYPAVWSDCAVASSLMPPDAVCPGLWRSLVSIVYSVFGIDGGNTAVSFLGKLFAGLVAALSYLTFKQILAILVRMIDPLAVWTKFFMRLLPIVGTILLLCSQSIWQLAQAFSPDSFAFLLFIATLILFLAFLSLGSLVPGYWAMFFVGLMCAESPFGFLVLASFWVIFYILLDKGKIEHIDFLEPLTQQSSKWYLTFFWALGFLLSIAVNVIGFVSMGGAEALGIELGGIPVKYISGLWNSLISSASIGGWIVGVGVAFLPFILGISLLRRGTDVEYFLRYHVGMVFFVISAVAYSQLASLPALWFWTFPSISVDSAMMNAVFAFMSAVAVFCGMCVAVVDVYCRDHRKLALQLNPELIPPERKSRLRAIVRDVLVAFSLLALIAGVLPLRFDATPLKMLAILDDYIREVVDEADGVKFLFTDGECDAAIELEAARRGKELVTVPIVPKSGSRILSSVRPMLTDEEEREAADVSGANLLVSMLNKNRSDIAVQYWLDIVRQKTARTYPPVSGVIARTNWPAEDVRTSGVERTYELAGRYLDFYKEISEIPESVDPVLRHYFQVSQFRLQCMAEFRLRNMKLSRKASEHSAALDGVEQFERNLSKNLNESNGALRELKAAIERVQKHVMHQVTPGDALMLALTRADFSAGRRHAERILETNPEDPRANFMMGMYSYMKSEYADAEKFFKECVRYNKREISYWNNLAMAEMKLGKYADARRSIATAKSLIANLVLEVKDTLNQIDEAEAAKK